MAVVQNGAFPPDTSSISCITIFQPSDGGTIIGGGTYCSISDTDTLFLSGITGSVLNWQSSTDGGTGWHRSPTSPLAPASAALKQAQNASVPACSNAAPQGRGMTWAHWRRTRQTAASAPAS